jgi:hypothetical protein
VFHGASRGHNPEYEVDISARDTARREGKEEAPSRGQVWKIDEEGRRATLLVNVDIGGYAPFIPAKR